MAQSIQDIMTSLDAGYNPARQTIQSQIDALPSQSAAQTAGLEGQQKDAFNSIQSGAQDRGMGFSGIPLAEQAKYTASTFLPAVAQVQKSQNDSKNTLLGALNQNNIDERNQAYTVQNQQQTLEQQQAQFEAQQKAARDAAAASSAGLSSLFGSGAGDTTQPADTPGTVTNTPQASYVKRSDNSYGFTDHNGKPINAAQYAQYTGQNIRNVLTSMALGGDSGAKAALGFIGADGRADPTKVTNPALANLYKAITGNNIAVYKPSSNNNILTNQGASNLASSLLKLPSKVSGSFSSPSNSSIHQAAQKALAGKK